MDANAKCRVISSPESYEGKQGPMYAGGVSAEAAGAKGLWLGTITAPPGGRTKAHYHAAHETAIYVLSGESEMWSGPNLEVRQFARAGDFIYIPAGVPHVAVNLSQTQPLIAVAARTDPNEQESVVLTPELDALIPSSSPNAG
jgi:uncharacterized RmlC-like cupin family protein